MSAIELILIALTLSLMAAVNGDVAARSMNNNDGVNLMQQREDNAVASGLQSGVGSIRPDDAEANSAAAAVEALQALQAFRTMQLPANNCIKLCKKCYFGFIQLFLTCTEAPCTVQRYTNLMKCGGSNINPNNNKSYNKGDPKNITASNNNESNNAGRKRSNRGYE